MMEEKQGIGERIASGYARFLGHRWVKWTVVAVWLLLAGSCVVPVMKLIPATSLNFAAPRGTPGYASEQLLRERFPAYVVQGSLVVLVTRVGGFNASGPTVVDSEYVRNLTYTLRDALTGAGYAADPSFAFEFESYWTMADQGYDMGAVALISDDGNSTLMTVTTREHTTHNSSVYTKYALAFVKALPENPWYMIQYTGQDAMMTELFSLCVREIAVTDGISTSIALIVLLILLGSLTLMAVPIINLGVSVLCGFGVLYPIALKWDVASFVPAICVAIIIAMSVDYALFLLSRYRQELDAVEQGAARDPEVYHRIMANTLGYAGRVIAISGTTLAITFLGLGFLTIQFLQTLGVCCAICLFITIAVNLTLGPSLLFCFPRFFSIRGALPCITSCRTLKEPRPIRDVAPEVRRKSAWYRVSKIITTNEGAALVLSLVIAALFPIIYANKSFSYKTDNGLVFSDDLPSMRTVDYMGKAFPPGFAYPFYVIAEPKAENGTTFGPDFFGMMPKFFKDMMNKTDNGIEEKGVISPAMAYGSPVDWKYAKMLTDPADPSHLYNTSYGEMYRSLLDRTLTKDHRATLMMLMTSFNPAGPRMDGWVAQVRKFLKNQTEVTPYNFSITNVLVDEVDACASSFRAFPIMIAITLSAVTIFVAITFRSLLMPIRLVFTLGLTVGWTYGLATLVFCVGIFDWMAPAGTTNKDGLYWVVPIIVLSIICGLGLDYDIFLFSRITEYRSKGHSTQSSIRLGYFQTGNIITGAGLVMAVAFSGLMLSSQRILTQLGFFLCLSVLLDTFVIRMLVVPALLHFFQDGNWWPIRMPKPSKNELGPANPEQPSVAAAAAAAAPAESAAAEAASTEATPLLADKTLNLQHP